MKRTNEQTKERFATKSPPHLSLSLSHFVVYVSVLGFITFNTLLYFAQGSVPNTHSTA